METNKTSTPYHGLTSKGANVTIPVVVGFVLLFLIVLVLLSWLVKRSTTSASASDVEAKGKPLDAETIDKLAPERMYSEWKKDIAQSRTPPGSSGSYIVCAICLNVLEDTDIIRQLPCGHVFHAHGIQRWLERNHNTCPLCNRHYSSTN